MSSTLTAPVGSAGRYLSSPLASNLHSISDPALSLCIWERPVESLADNAIEAWVNSGQKLAVDIRFAATENPASSILAAAPGLCRTSAQSGIQAWLRDLEVLSRTFAELAGCPAVRLRLETVNDPACAVFHADTLSLRLLCTYRGPGTQWLEEANVRRDELGLNQRSIEEANAAIVRDPAQIRTTPAWHVMVFKGRLWPGDEVYPLVHRSYPVCCPEHSRIRLVIDPLNWDGRPC